MNILSDVSIAILAGGASSRMGADKSLLTFGASDLLKIQLDRFKCLSDDVFILSGNRKYAGLEDYCVQDKFYDIGPIGGLHSALCHAKNPWILLWAVDSPKIEKSFIFQSLGKKKSAVIPVYEKDIHYVNAFYNKSAIETITSQIDSKNYSMHHLANQLKCDYIRLDNPLSNLNTKKEYQQWMDNHNFTYIIELYGKFQEIFNGRTLKINLAMENISLTTLENELMAQYPYLNRHSYSWGINQEHFAKGSNILLESKDKLALFPPFSGG